MHNSATTKGATSNIYKHIYPPPPPPPLKINVQLINQVPRAIKYIISPPNCGPYQWPAGAQQNSYLQDIPRNMHTVRALLCFVVVWNQSIYPYHDDVIKWNHFPRYWPFVRGIHRSQVNFPHKGQWRGALMFSLICAWINGWVNNGEAGDLRRYRAHYDVTVMILDGYLNGTRDWSSCSEVTLKNTNT